MRFDDRLATILALPADGQQAKAAIWSQLASLLAQKNGTLPADQEADARALEAMLRPDVPLNRRKFSATSLAGRINDVDTLLIFGQDAASVAAPVLTHAQLSEVEWREVIPRLPSTSRALLRERRDLPESVTRILRAYGAGDTGLISSQDTFQAASKSESPTQIRDLVARIEAFKNEREAGVAPKISAPPPHDAKALSFRFETDRAGVICWVEGVPRGPLIGISFAEISEPRVFGVDGQAAGAFRKRLPFPNARLRVAGVGVASGDWLISADPSFDAGDGRFCGYRGIARRAELGEQTSSAAAAPFGKDMSADAIRQLVHELRSPLNAIRGFAEMIDGQLLGPVSHPYRHKARAIVEDSIRLVNIVDDIDLSAQLEMENRTTTTHDVTNVAEMVETALLKLDPQITRYGIHLKLSTCTELPLCAVDSHSGARLIERMISTMIGLAKTGEMLKIDVTKNHRQIIIAIDRQHIINFDTSNALSTDTEYPSADPPPLGLNFALRLIRRMAQSVGGQFIVEASKFALILPQAHDSEKKTIEGG
ncbi:MAG: histidine kinase dimerization/phospho-acceptor domain-containing protein [Pseudomonadota bacterium]